MGRTVYYAATTLDGYLADERDSLDWLFVQDLDEHGPMSYDAFLATVGAITMGSTTYEWLMRHQEETGEGWPYDLPCRVFTSRDLPVPEGADVAFVSGDVAPVHAELSRLAGERVVWVVGGGDLAAQHAEAGLLDELVLFLAPVTLGAGRPLFPRPFDLRLEELDRNGAFVCARYAVVGPRGAG
jgi:dihydrofolate reductase